MQPPIACVKQFAIGSLILLLAAETASGAAVSPYHEVPGRVVLNLSPEGAEALREGRFVIPQPQKAAGLLHPKLAPLFPETSGPLSRFALLTWDVEKAASLAPELARNTQWIEAVLRGPGVVSAQSDGFVQLSALPRDPFFGDQFQLHNLGGLSLRHSEAWPFISPDDEVVVAVLDSGVDWPHPDLGGPSPVLDQPKGVMWLNEAEADGQAGVDDDGNGYIDDFVGWDFVDVPSIPPEYSAPPAAQLEDGETPDNEPLDYSGHGTYCAGLVTAITNNDLGLAGQPPGVRVMPVRIAYAFNGSWGAGIAFFTWIAQALVYAADTGADVASCSFHVDFYPDVLADAVDHAVYGRGMSIVAAAGNFATSDTAAGQAFLAAQPEVIGVAGLDTDGSKWSGSNYGPWVNIAAFAWGMPSTYQRGDSNAYNYFTIGQGTSWACPMVAGGVALIRSAAPELNPLEVRDALVSTGRDLTLYEPTFADRLGGGLADIPAAIEAVGGGWQRSLGARNLTPMDGGLLAVTGDSGVVVLDVATAHEHFTWEGAPLTPVPPVVLHEEGQPYLGFASGSPGSYALNLVDSTGAVQDGWPVSIDNEPKEIAVTKWGDANKELLVALEGEGLSLWDWTGTLVASESRFPAEHLVVGDFNRNLAGEEIAGYAAGQQLLFSSQGLVVTLIPGLTLGPSEPVGIFLQNGEAVVFAASDSILHALDGGVLERSGFPIRLGIESLSLVGDPGGDLYVLAAEAGGRVHRVGLDGTSTSWAAPGPLTGELLAMDLNRDFQPDVLLSREDGTLSARTLGFTRTPGFPRNFPLDLRGTPSAQDHPNGNRYVAAIDDSGRVWSLPLRGQADTQLVWFTERGSARRTGSLTYGAATPVVTASLHWTWSSGGSGEFCWNGAWGSEVESFRVETPREQIGADGSTRCVSLHSARSGETVVLQARFRGQSAYVELGRLNLPPVRLAFLTASPNPFSQGASLRFPPAPPGTDLAIFDLRGRLVFRVPIPRGTTYFTWDGAQSGGGPAGPGIYFARVTQGRVSETVKLVRTP